MFLKDDPGLNGLFTSSVVTDAPVKFSPFFATHIVPTHLVFLLGFKKDCNNLTHQI